MEAEGGERAERTANMDRMSVTLDVSKLSGWLKANAPCRVERGTIRGVATCGQPFGRVGWVGRWRKQQEGPDCVAEVRALAERTENIVAMSVTRDVSQLDMSALKLFLFAKSPFISVTAETSQLEIGPYVAVAEAALAL